MSPSTDRAPAAGALYALAHWLLGRDRDDDALHVFRTMMQVAPHDERSWLGLGHCHERRGEAALAERLYGMASVAIPSSFRCALARARLLAQRGDTAADTAFELAEERARDVGDDDIAKAIASERRLA